MSPFSPLPPERDQVDAEVLQAAVEESTHHHLIEIANHRKVVRQFNDAKGQVGEEKTAQSHARQSRGTSGNHQALRRQFWLGSVLPHIDTPSLS